MYLIHSCVVIIIWSVRYDDLFCHWLIYGYNDSRLCLVYIYDDIFYIIMLLYHGMKEGKFICSQKIDAYSNMTEFIYTAWY